MVDGTYSISSLGRRYYYLVLIHSRAGSSSRFKLQAFEKDRLIQPLFDYPYPNTTSQSKSNGDCHGRFSLSCPSGPGVFRRQHQPVAAWVVGMRNVMAAFLRAFLLPRQMLLDLERAGDFTGWLVLQEAWKKTPFNAVWTYYCAKENVPEDHQLMGDIRQYEETQLAQRQ